MESGTHVKKLKSYDQVSLNRAVIKVGTAWCKACKSCKEDYKEMAAKNSNIDFYDADADYLEGEKSMMKEINNIVKKASVLPTFFFFRKGKVVHTLEGFKRDKFKEYLREIS